ncbi:unnamed protein product [Amoebophrya sp. A25]|nr:unnamed protein product [Amoebophrya sp. A25]|eukprot:GSA25T00013670001.1
MSFLTRFVTPARAGVAAGVGGYGLYQTAGSSSSTTRSVPVEQDARNSQPHQSRFNMMNSSPFWNANRRRSVLCDDGKSPFDMAEMQGKLLGMVGKPEWITPDTMKPLTGGLTFGGATGLAAGYACKKAGKVLAVGVGSLYCLFQVAASYGYVTINWKKVEKDCMNILDTNGDGKLDEKDAGVWLQKALNVLATDELEGTTIVHNYNFSSLSWCIVRYNWRCIEAIKKYQ